MNTPTHTSIELTEIMKSTHKSTTDDAMHLPPTSLVISTSDLANDYVSVDSSVSAYSPLSLTEGKENQVQPYVPPAPRNLYSTSDAVSLNSPSNRNKPRHSPNGTLTNKFVARAPSPLADVKPNRNEKRLLPYASRVLCRPDVSGVGRFSPSPRGTKRWPFDETTQVHLAKEASSPAVPHVLAMGCNESDTSSLDSYKSEDESVDASIADDDAFSHSRSSTADGVPDVDHECTDASNVSFSDDADDAPMTTDKSTQMTRPLILQPFVKKEFSDDDEALKYSSSSDGVSGVEHESTAASDASFSDSSTPSVEYAEDSPTPFVESGENCIADKSTQTSRPTIDHPINSAFTIKKELGYDGEELDDPIDEVVMADKSTQMTRPLVPQPVKEELSDDDEALKSIIDDSNDFVSGAADAPIQADLSFASDVEEPVGEEKEEIEIQSVSTKCNHHEDENKQDEEANVEVSLSSKQLSLEVHASTSNQHLDPESFGDHSSIASSSHSRNTSELIDEQEGGGAVCFSLSSLLVEIQDDDVSSERLDTHAIPSASAEGRKQDVRSKDLWMGSFEGAETSSVKSAASKLCGSDSNEDVIGVQHGNGENENSMNGINDIEQFASVNNSIRTWQECDRDADSGTLARDNTGDSFGCNEEEQSNQLNEFTTTSGTIPRNCNFKLDDANQQLEKDNRDLRSNAENMKSRNNVLTDELARVKDSLDKLAKENARLKEIGTETESHAKQLDQNKVELKCLEEVKNGMEEKLDAANQKVAELADNVIKLTGENRTLSISLGKCNDEIETLKKENTIPFEVANGVGDSYDSAGDDDGDESCSYNSASEISGWSGWGALQADYGKLEKELGNATKENEKLQAMVDIGKATTLIDLENENEELRENVKMLVTKNIKLADQIDLYRSCFVEDDGSTCDIVTSLYKHRARLMHEIDVTDKVIQDRRLSHPTL